MNLLPRLLVVILAFTLLGCPFSKNDPEPDFVELNTPPIYWRGTYQFSMYNDPSAYQWVVKDTLVGNIDDAGLFTARKIGETIVSATSPEGKTENYKIKVSPFVNFFRDPHVAFGDSKDKVKSYEKRTILSQDANTLEYIPESKKISNIIYSFDNAKLSFVSLLFPASFGSGGNDLVYIAERYPVLYGVWESDDGKVRVSKFDIEIQGEPFILICLYPPNYYLFYPPTIGK